jgi:hypothetical protein
MRMAMAILYPACLFACKFPYNRVYARIGSLLTHFKPFSTNRIEFIYGYKIALLMQGFSNCAKNNWTLCEQT